MAKRTNERDSARKIFDILLNRFGSGVQGHQDMVKFEKRRQRYDKSIDKFLDDLELFRRRSNPDDRFFEQNLAVASKFMDGVKSEELKTMLATHFTLSLDQVPTPDDLRMKTEGANPLQQLWQLQRNKHWRELQLVQTSRRHG